jgi:hypothetical protein
LNPTGVSLGILQFIVPEVVEFIKPIGVGLVNKPLALDNWAVKVFGLVKVPVVVYESVKLSF